MAEISRSAKHRSRPVGVMVPSVGGVDMLVEEEVVTKDSVMGLDTVPPELMVQVQATEVGHLVGQVTVHLVTLLEWHLGDNTIVSPRIKPAVQAGLAVVHMETMAIATIARGVTRTT